MTANLFKQPQNMTGFNDFLLNHVNDVYLAGTLGIWINMMVFVIIFVPMLRFGVRRAFAAAAAPLFLVTTLMVPLDLAGVNMWAMSFVLFITAIIFAKEERGVAR